MPELSRYLFLAGAIPFVVLGLAHAMATPVDVGQVKGLAPADPGLAAVMAQTPLRLTRRTNMWLTWVGFNLSHSLGALFFGVAVLVAGRSASSFAVEGPIFVPLAVAVSTAYTVLGVKYWFRTPIVGCAVSAALFACSWVAASIP